MFGFDLTKMLSGEGGGGNMITNMLMKQLSAPGTTKMINGKIDEMFSFLANNVNADKSKVMLSMKLEMVPVKDENGNLLMEPGKDGSSGAVQKLEQKAIVYVVVDGKAVQKIAIDQFLAMMTQEQGG